MSQTIPTVKIKSDRPKGYRVINESGFDPKVHERFDEPPAPPPPPFVPPAPPPPVDPLADLPADWSTKLSADQLKSIAVAATGRAVENRKQAIEVITEELAKRAS